MMKNGLAVRKKQKLNMRTLRRIMRVAIGVVWISLMILAGIAAYSFSEMLFATEAPPKYIFLFIGDGMGHSQMTLASLYKTSVLNEEDLIMNSFTSIGLSHTGSGESAITESAAAASAIASGINDIEGRLNIDADGVGHETIAEKLKNQLGHRIGIISSVNINHSTPAAFYSRQESHHNFADIFNQLVNSGFEYFGGGGTLADLMITGRYSSVTGIYVDTRHDIIGVEAWEGRLVAISPSLDRHGTIPYKIDNKDNERGTFTLAEHTRKAIEMLHSPDDDAGFFIMVEGGKIDWAAHANDAASMIYEIIDFDNAIREAVEFYRRNPSETLIIVTGDHETGGLSLGYAGTTLNLFLNYLTRQTMSFSEYELRVDRFREQNYTFEEVLADIKRVFFGVYDPTTPVFHGHEIEQLLTAYHLSMMEPEVRPFTMTEFLNYGFYDPVTMTAIRILNLRAGISWSSWSHTATPVPVLALGVGETRFTGIYRSREIFFRLKELMELE